MKLKTLILLIVLPMAVSAQTSPCSEHVDSKKFIMKLSELREFSQIDQKYKMAFEMLDAHCFSSDQVKDIMSEIGSDRHAYAFATQAYRKTVDKKNFFMVFDAFERMSSAILLYDYLKEADPNFRFSPTMAPEIPEINNSTNLGMTYPQAGSYAGNVNCKKPLSDKAFENLLYQVKNVKSDQGKLNNASNMLRDHCVTTAQLMKIAGEIGSEDLRMELMRRGYKFVYDKDNYLYVKQLLTNIDYIHEINSIYEPPLKPKPHQESMAPQHPPVQKPTDCKVEHREMNNILASLKDVNFEETRLKSAKQIIKRKKCFRTEQIMRMMELFSFEESRLELAKYAYPFTTDQDRYYKINDSFDFSSSKEELNEFLKNQK